MNVSHFIVCGLLVTLLSFTTEAKPLTAAEKKILGSLLGDHLSELLASEEREQNLENVQSRLLRDLRLGTRAKGAWSRYMNDQPGSRKQKQGSKKGGSPPRNGCFGHKMERIGTLSGMGC